MQHRKHFKLAIFFAVTFAFFFYMSFPYGVLKELISTQIVNFTGFSVRMDELSPRIPLGFKARAVSLTPPESTRSVEIDSVIVKLKILPLLIGNLSLGIYVDSGKGSLDLDLAFSLFGLISQKSLFPHYLSLESDNFKLDELVNFGLATLADSPSINALLQPVVKGVGFSAKLSGEAKIDLNSSDPQNSSAKVNLTFKDAILKLSDPALGLPDQKFSVAKILMNLDKGALKIDPQTKLQAEELSVAASGSVQLKKLMSMSELNVQIPIKLGGSLREKFGFLLDAMTGGAPRNGEVTVQMRGTFNAPVTTF